MIKEHTLFSNRYKFKHLQISVIDKDVEENVHVFSATFVKTALPGKMSDGLIEINKTLWDQSSTKRPKGYIVFGGNEKEGVATSYLVSEEWLNSKDTIYKDGKRKEWEIQ